MSSRALPTAPSFCAPNDKIKYQPTMNQFLPGLVLAKIQLTVQVWSHFRRYWSCEILCQALVPKLGIAWKQILISLINRDIKSWNARCRDEWRLMRSHLAAISRNVVAVRGRREHLAVSHTGINEEEVFSKPVDSFWFILEWLKAQFSSMGLQNDKYKPKKGHWICNSCF